MRKRLILNTLAVLLLFCLVGCTTAGSEKSASSAEKNVGESAAGEKETLRFAVGPYQPTPEDTQSAYEPFIQYVAEQLGVNYEMTVTNDWAGISMALASDQIDLAWMGPWGYVLAHHESAAEAIATVKYDGKPTYHSIIVAGADQQIENFPEDAQGMSISFADVGSTSGWLIPTYYFMTQDINPEEYFEYSEGASHAANEISVAEEHVDLATDYDRNRTAMIESGRLDAEATQIVWQSDPLPNDPIVVRQDFDSEMKQQVQDILVNMSAEEAEDILPAHYTGFVEADHNMYRIIEEAGIAVGKIRED